MLKLLQKECISDANFNIKISDNNIKVNAIVPSDSNKIKKEILGYENLPLFSPEILITQSQKLYNSLLQWEYRSVCLKKELVNVTNLEISILKAKCTNLIFIYNDKTSDINHLENFFLRFSFIYRVNISTISILSDKTTNRNTSSKRDNKSYQYKKAFERLIDNTITQESVNININDIVMKADEKMNVNLSNLYSALNQAGIYKYKIDGLDKFILIKNNSIIKELDKYQIKDIVLNEMKNKGLTLELEKIYQGSNFYFNQNTLSNLEHKRSLPEYIGEPGLEHFFFNGIVWKINKTSISQIKYEEFDSFIWESNVIDWYPNLEDDFFSISKNHLHQLTISLKEGYCDFLDFIINTSNVYWKIPNNNLSTDQLIEIEQHIINKITCIGYLLHTYREQSVTRAIIATDFIERGSKEEHGGTGKSLFGKALIEMLSTYYRGARNKNLFSDKHLLGGIDQTTKLVFFDDANKNFDWEQLYTLITGQIDINRKFQDPQVLDRERSIKFYITTNYAVHSHGNSHDRRFFYVVFSDYYGPDKKPSDDFETDFFSKTWSWEQKNRFYNFMAQCVKAYLKWGLVEAPKENLEKNKLRASINELFLDWAEDNYREFLNKETDKLMLFEQFKASLSEIDAKKFSSTSFKKNMKNFCKLKGFIFNPSKEGKDIKRNSTEYFEIYNINNS
ncbi:primase-helicase family protein [Plebeiibacterium sediminum]|uniref:DUF5906 domain-containing protein n=1 Tax=Plebeiibacterium sediminum TaxID=2992112 RepID=A0AAE3M7X1_9BACT|nr:primase-helicase family protein [Plebeiobacterium sediminum]MCW3788906.1 DUF5906 domain-containing protein [Plebeiobacterium sediminum]